MLAARLFLGERYAETFIKAVRDPIQDPKDAFDLGFRPRKKDDTPSFIGAWRTGPDGEPLRRQQPASSFWARVVSFKKSAIRSKGRIRRAIMEHQLDHMITLTLTSGTMSRREFSKLGRAFSKQLLETIAKLNAMPRERRLEEGRKFLAFWTDRMKELRKNPPTDTSAPKNSKRFLERLQNGRLPTPAHHVGVPELQERGVWHAHIAIGAPVPIEIVFYVWHQVAGAQAGFVHIARPKKGPHGVFAYLVKYLQKAFSVDPEAFADLPEDEAIRQLDEAVEKDAHRYWTNARDLPLAYRLFETLEALQKELEGQGFSILRFTQIPSDFGEELYFVAFVRRKPSRSVQVVARDDLNTLVA